MIDCCEPDEAVAAFGRKLPTFGTSSSGTLPGGSRKSDPLCNSSALLRDSFLAETSAHDVNTAADVIASTMKTKSRELLENCFLEERLAGVEADEYFIGAMFLSFDPCKKDCGLCHNVGHVEPCE